MPIRSSERNSSVACCLVRDIARQHYTESRPIPRAVALSRAALTIVFQRRLRLCNLQTRIGDLGGRRVLFCALLAILVTIGSILPELFLAQPEAASGCAQHEEHEHPDDDPAIARESV